MDDGSKATGPVAGYVVLFILCIGGLCGMILGVSARASAGEPEITATPPPDEPPEPPPVTEGKLVIEDLVVGTGAEAKSGDKVKTHYVGTFLDGSEFDSSKKRDRTFDFDLGKGRVIKGWDEGLVGMKVGGKRKLVIPPHLAYGSRGVPSTIPPNSTLVFEVELIAVEPR